jgi:hypothetical protein
MDFTNTYNAMELGRRVKTKCEDCDRGFRGTCRFNFDHRQCGSEYSPYLYVSNTLANGGIGVDKRTKIGGSGGRMIGPAFVGAT